jgi:Flp pilus assembly protein TadD
MPRPASSRYVFVTASCLFVVTLAVYGRTLQCDFVNYDDPAYVTENDAVQAGLTMRSLAWAFTSFRNSNWHPLTWLSLELEYQLYRDSPAGFHLTNIMLHAWAAALLFLLLQRMTSDLWPSAIVAGLFALHPLHVESVVWITERKDVLSAFFALLTCSAYVRYVMVRSPWAYVAALVSFSLGLMCKPMLVTMPFVLLLFDYWPLERWPKGKGLSAPARAAGFGLLTEKLPFFALSLASCAVTLWGQGQGGAVSSLTAISLDQRLANAIVTYGAYLVRAVWPDGLAIFYPYRAITWHAGQVWVMLTALTIVSAIAVRTRLRWPYLFVGWFMYLGMLVPVIGMVQVGGQASADRYTYLPLIGIFIAVTWGGQRLIEHLRLPSIAVAGAVGVVAIVLATCTYQQVGTWQDSVALWRQAIQAAPPNATADWLLGSALIQANQLEEATEWLNRALELEPAQPAAHYNLGFVLEKKGRSKDAMEHFRQALENPPGLWQAHVHLALGLWKRGRNDEACDHLRAAARAEPRLSHAHTWLGKFHEQKGDWAEAIEEYRHAVESEPTSARAYNDLAVALGRRGEFARSFEAYMRALELAPGDAEVHNNLGIDLARDGKIAEALPHCRQAVALDAANVQYRANLAFVLFRSGKVTEARSEYDRVCRQDHEWLSRTNQLAWTLATSPEDIQRNGCEALVLAQELCQASRDRAEYLDTLAAAYAESGRFPEAVAAARRALALARDQTRDSAHAIEERLRLYQAGKAFRDSTGK